MHEGSSEQRYCTNCGSQISPRDAFCGSCGARLSSSPVADDSRTRDITHPPSDQHPAALSRRPFSSRMLVETSWSGAYSPWPARGFW